MPFGPSTGTPAQEYAARLGEDWNQRVAKIQIPVPKPPEIEQEFPSNLSELSDEELSAQMGFWAQMYGYAQYRAAQVGAAATRAKVEFETEFDRRYTAVTETTVTDRRHLAGGHSAVISRRTRAAELDADAQVLRAAAVACEYKYQVLSRELTRRKVTVG